MRFILFIIFIAVINQPASASASASETCRDKIITAYDKIRSVAFTDEFYDLGMNMPEVKRTIDELNRIDDMCEIPLIERYSVYPHDVLSYTLAKITGKGFLEYEYKLSLAKVCNKSPETCLMYSPPELTKSELSELNDIFK